MPKTRSETKKEKSNSKDQEGNLAQRVEGLSVGSEIDSPPPPPRRQNLVNVTTPDDGRCMFFAIANSILIPLINNEEEFQTEFGNIFPDHKSHFSHTRDLLKQVTQEYTTNPRSEIAQTILKNDEKYGALIQNFRERTVQTMYDNIVGNEERRIEANPEYYSGFNVEGIETIDESYLDSMKNPETWAGNYELVAISDLLSKRIKLPTTEIQNQRLSDYSSAVEIHYNGSNHYEAMLNPNVLEKDADEKYSDSSELEKATGVKQKRIKPLPFIPSDEIVAACNEDSAGKYSMKAKGRANPVFNGTDGDHKIALGFLEKSFLHFVQNVSTNPESGLDDLKRGNRASVHNLISTVAALNPEKRQNLYEGLSQDLEKSKSKRIPRSTLNFLETEIDANSDSSRSKLYQDLLNREQTHNGELILTYLVSSYRRYATFCSKIPGNSFIRINGLEAASNEGSRVASTNRLLEKIEDPNMTLELLTKGMSDSFFLLQAPEELLEKHKEDTKAQLQTGLKDKIKEYTRDNSQEELEKSISQYIAIILSARPEMCEKFTIDEIINSFSKKVIQGTHQVKNPNKKKETITLEQGWEKFAADEKVGEIVGNVKQRVEEIQRDAEENHYTKYPGYISGKSTPVGGRTRSNSEVDKTKKIANQLLLYGQEPADLIDALEVRLGGKNMPQGNKDAFEQFKRSLEDNKELDKGKVIDLLSDLEDFLKVKKKQPTPQEFLEQLNEILEDKLNISYTTNIPLRSDNYASTVANTVSQIKTISESTINKNELMNVLNNNCKKQETDLGTKKEESFVKKLHLEEKSELKSFAEKMQSKSSGGFHEI